MSRQKADKPQSTGYEGASELPNRLAATIVPPKTVNDEDLAAQKRRARYRAWHRGTKELDLILGAYADAHLEGFDAARLEAFEALLASEEVPLQRVLMGQDAPPEGPLGELMTEIRHFQIERAANNG